VINVDCRQHVVYEMYEECQTYVIQNKFQLAIMVAVAESNNAITAVLIKIFTVQICSYQDILVGLANVSPASYCSSSRSMPDSLQPRRKCHLWQ